jgi:hypothetical protein
MASTNTGQEGLVLSFLFDTDEWVLGNTARFRKVGSTIDRVKLISAVADPTIPISVYAGEREVRPPGAPTAAPVLLESELVPVGKHFATRLA